EAPHLIRAVVGAIARSDAAVINLLVQTLRTGRGGQHRTHRLARSILAMLAHHGLVHARRILFRSAVVAVNPDPVHDAGTLHLVSAHHRNIVFRLAGDHAGRATCTSIHINRHSP